MKSIQLQKQKSVDAKLDKIKRLLEEVLVELDSGNYPSDAQVKASTLKRLNKLVSDIAQGKRQTIKFRNIHDLDRIVSSYKV